MKTASPVSFLVLCVLLFTSGCVSGGKKWWSPATWFSDSSAKAADLAGTYLAKKQGDAVQAAKVEVAKTGEALSHAPDSREVALAIRFNDNADALLAQAAQPLTVAERQAVKQLVAELRSDNAAIRSAAESRQKSSEQRQAALSEELAAAEKKLSAAQSELRTAFDRENALANELRNERVVKWSLAGAALICALGWAYLRYVAGGLPSALGSMMARLEKKSPTLAEDIRPFLDSETNRSEQAGIRAAYLKAREAAK